MVGILVAAEKRTVATLGGEEAELVCDVTSGVYRSGVVSWAPPSFGILELGN